MKISKWFTEHHRYHSTFLRELFIFLSLKKLGSNLMQFPSSSTMLPTGSWLTALSFFNPFGSARCSFPWALLSSSQSSRHLPLPPVIQNTGGEQAFSLQPASPCPTKVPATQQWNRQYFRSELSMHTERSSHHKLAEFKILFTWGATEGWLGFFFEPILFVYIDCKKSCFLELAFFFLKQDVFFCSKFIEMHSTILNKNTCSIL